MSYFLSIMISAMTMYTSTSIILPCNYDDVIYISTTIHPIILVMILIMTTNIIYAWKYIKCVIDLLIVTVYHFFLLWIVHFWFFHFFIEMGFISFLFLLVVLLEFRTIYFEIPIFITLISLDLWHINFLVKLILRLKFPKFSFLPCWCCIFLCLFIWAKIVVRFLYIILSF